MSKSLSDVLNEKVDKMLVRISEPKFLEQVANQVVSDIIKRTKLGYGVNTTGGPQSKLKPLSDDYKKYRKKQQLGEFGTPSKSNLTLTGAMLNDLVVSISGTKITIKLGSSLSNNKEQWQRKQGRIFFNISKVQISMLTTLIKNKLKEAQ